MSRYLLLTINLGVAALEILILWNRFLSLVVQFAGSTRQDGRSVIDLMAGLQ